MNATDRPHLSDIHGVCWCGEIHNLTEAAARRSRTHSILDLGMTQDGDHFFMYRLVCSCGWWKASKASPSGLAFEMTMRAYEEHTGGTGVSRRSSDP